MTICHSGGRVTRRWLALPALAVSTALWSLPAAAQFDGMLGFEPDGCMAKRECILKFPLKFTDMAKRVWQADAGDVTDGASIPDWAQGIIGGPWDESYLKAAVLHDHYCGKRNFSWRETHLMFYEALIELGVNSYKAKLMYYAVYAGGPRWLDVVAPTCGEGTKTPCGAAQTVQTVDQIKRASNYDDMNLHKEMQDVAAYMDAHPDTSLDDIRAMAEKNHPEDVFLKRGDALGAGDPVDRFMRSSEK